MKDHGDGLCLDIRLILGGFQGHMAQAHHPGLLAQPQNRNQQTLEANELNRRNSMIRLWSDRWLPDSTHENQIIVARAPERPTGTNSTYFTSMIDKYMEDCVCIRGLKTLLPARILGQDGDQDGRVIQLVRIYAAFTP